MKTLFFTLVLSFINLAIMAQGSDEKTVLTILQKQAVAWNQGNIDEFMTGYWNNDSLMFVGKNGVTYGYNNVLNNYKANYSDTIKMGKLSFEFLKVKKISPEYCWVLGKWFLKRTEGGNVGGHYTLLFKKINGKWLVISDHSS